ncbi:unnamed protein product, partial [Effrenium voratum]
NAHLSWRARLKPEWVAVHPANRDGSGVSPSCVHQLASDISECGWDWAQIRALCVELSHKEIPLVVKFNQELDAHVDDTMKLAPIIKETIRYGSLSASHTNCALRLFAASCLHDGNPDLLVKGKLSLHQLRDKDAAYADAAENGLTWSIISSTVITRYPALCGLLQQAMNTGAQLQRQEGELQICLRLLGAWQQEAKSKPDTQVQFKEIRSKVLRTKPSCSNAAPFMYTFILRYGGGADGQWIRESEQFVKRAGGSQRQLGPDRWDNLSLPGKGGEHLLRLRHAALRVSYIEEKPLSVSDLRRLLRSNDAAAAEQLMQDVRELGRITLASDLHQEVLLFEHQIVTQLLDRTGRLPSMEHAAQAFIVKVQERGGPLLTEKWSAFTVEKPAVAGPMLTYDRHGELAECEAIVKELGFNAGDAVMRRADKVAATISGFTQSHVILRIESGLISGTAKVLAKSFSKKEWTHCAAKKEVEEVQEHWQHRIGSHVEFGVLYLKGKITAALLQEELKHLDTLQHLTIQAKPFKNVVATKNFATNKLVLVPMTTRISTQLQKSGAQLLGELMAGPEGGLSFWLVPCFAAPKPHPEGSKGMIAPFWLVQTTEQPDEANMEVTPDLGSHNESDKLIHQVTIKVPVMKNTRAIKAGEQLVVHRKKDTKVPDLEEIIPTAAPMKRRRLKTSE